MIRGAACAMTPRSVTTLADVVRKAALPGVWSQGVKLVREQGVARVSGNAKEAVLRVRAPGHAVAPTVTLYLEDEEWSCDCDSKADPCAHVAAAAIALAQGPAEGEGAAAEAPAPATPTAAVSGLPAEAAAPALASRILYRFARRERRLALTRVIVSGDGKEQVVRMPITSDAARGRLPRDLAPTHEDVKIDRLLGATSIDVVPLDRLAPILDALTGNPDVTLDGAPIRASGEKILPIATVSDGPNGAFVLRVDRDASVTEIVAAGVAIAAGDLRPLGETPTTGERLEKLPLVRSFGKTEQTELVTRVLPDLEKKIVVDVATRRLPRKTQQARPRIVFDLGADGGHALSVLPLLVYGDPPIARVDADALVPIGRTKEAPVRRVSEERALLAKLRTDLDLVLGRRVSFDGDAAARFAARLRAFQIATGEAEAAAVRDEGKLVAAIRQATDGTFDIVFELEGGDDAKTAEAASVLRAWQGGLDLVPLHGGGWAKIPADWLAKHGARVADLLAARDAEGKLPKAVLPDLGVLAQALDHAPPFGLDALAPLLREGDGVPHARLPEDLNATLREYQTRGVDWLAFLRDAELGAVLADDMGLGKTLQTIASLRGKVLVVCPRSVVHNWADEIARFRPGLRVAVYHGTERTLDTTADVTLTTYAVLRIDIETLAASRFDVVVLDEAQAIKNPTSQTARAAFQLRAGFRVALSGTPIENRLEELWSVMHFANPGLLGGLSSFQERYVTPIGNGDPAAAARLRARIKPFVLRRMKRDVLPELPPRTEARLFVELEDAERAVYDAVRAATRKDVTEKLAQGGSVLAALEALLRLRQAASHPALVPGQRADTSSKVERLLEKLEEAVADGHKALVFSQWTSMLDLVEPHLTQAGIRFTRLDGSTRDRGAVVAELSAEDGVPVMLVSLKAGGTGLNLTAADHVFLLDPWWNPAVEDQAADRAHRIGQDKPVMVYRLVARDTVEERILALQEKKRNVADVALGEAGQAGGITRDDLLALLA